MLCIAALKQYYLRYLYWIKSLRPTPFFPDMIGKAIYLVTIRQASPPGPDKGASELPLLNSMGDYHTVIVSICSTFCWQWSSKDESEPASQNCFSDGHNHGALLLWKGHEVAHLLVDGFITPPTNTLYETRSPKRCIWFRFSNKRCTRYIVSANML